MKVDGLTAATNLNMQNEHTTSILTIPMARIDRSRPTLNLGTTTLNIFFHPLKAAAMNGAIAEFPYGLLVGPGRVAFVFGEIELGIIMMVSLHQTIPGDLGDNGCGGYGNA